MQRYFVPPEQFRESTVLVAGDDAHHIQRVMRLGVGDTFICSNGVDREALVAIERIDKTEITARVVNELAMDREPAVSVWIAQSLPKGDKLETVIQKGTELGATRFLPFESERTVVQYDAKKESKRLDRWRKIAKEAAEQAHRNRVPAVDAPCDWRQLLSQAGAADLALLCYEKQEALTFRELLRERIAARTDAGAGGSAASMTIAVIVGPEGGFTEREAEEAIAAGCRAISLGKRILRTETAALVALSCIMYETGEMGG